MSPSWSDEAGATVRADVLALVNGALDVIGRSGHGFPIPDCFLVLMDLEGEVTARLGFGDDVGSMVAPFLDDHGSLRAILCVSEPGSEEDPRLQAFGDHREGPPFACGLIWRRVGDSTRLEVSGAMIGHSHWWLFE